MDPDFGMRKTDLFGLKIELGSIMSLDDKTLKLWKSLKV